METATTARDNRNKELLDRLKQGVIAVFDSSNYKNYLSVMSRFHSYSPRNCVLIWLQRPDATYIAGYRDWMTKFHRYVRKGEKAIHIFAPMLRKVKSDDPDSEEKVMRGCRIVSVFDYSQTEGEELPDVPITQLDSDVDAYDKIMQALRSVSPVPIFIAPIDGSENGNYDPVKGRITVRAGMSQAQTIKTTVHEIAHALMHSNPKARDAPDRSTKETQAESVAYIVCDHLGLDTSEYSFPYVASWSKDRDVRQLTASLDAIRSAANEIIAGIDGAMQAA